ncbi:polysaccharide biosynthesis tyrosine autokinase [uncultured Cedecea sp.]|uniref:polysaccharide biosynthesis tyrosine autokinase n=1 Tax=uncultured Cedecea sp. TaxID=988762 RepID=UPI00262236B7|nr:polysaccharide biosynthesis tyrosine autokinase [uncultured Cedecea sp.]
MTTKNTQKQNTPSTENELDLGRLLGDLIDHRKLIIGVTLLSTACALVYALFATPVYQADTLVQVEQKKGNAILSSLSQMIPDSSPESAPELQLLQSRMILGKTVNDLNLRTVVSEKFFPIFGEGWARLSGQPEQTLDVNWLNLSLGRDSSKSVLVTVGENGKYQVSLDDDITLQGTVGELLNDNGIDIKISSIDAKPGTEFVVTQYSELAAINNLQQNFTVSEKSKDSGMLGLTMSGEDPILIEKILNNISDNYLQQNIARQAAQDSKSLEFLQKKMPEVRNELDEAEDKLNAYRKQSDSVDLNLEAKSVLEQVVNVDNQINGLTFREAEISQLYKKDHPTYKALMEKRQTLEQEKARLNKRVSGMPATQQEVLRLSRDVESGRAVYSQLLNRQQELSIAQSSAIGNVRIIDPALTQPKPIKPKKPLIVILGFFLGLFASAGIVLASSVLRRGIETPEQLEEQGINVYATVPTSEWLLKRTRLRSKNFFSNRVRHKTKNVPFLALDNPIDLSIEAIRGLRTSLHFAMMEASNNVLMISGATPDSGKTFISSSLAAIISQPGQKVLFIDADMRRGYIHELFQMSNDKGLSDILSGKTSASDAVQTFHKAGFDVITRGMAPPNPSELLMHERFKQLLTWASENYDMVIIDTPPILAVTDAAIIGRSVGTSLVVARFEMNSVKEIMVCVQRLEQAGVTVKGAILNGVMKRASSQYGYGYHHYGYDYTDKA